MQPPGCDSSDADAVMAQVVLTAVAQQPEAMQWASRAVVIVAVRECGMALRCAAAEHREDREVR